MTQITNETPIEITFETFLLSLGTAALVALGEIDNPVTKKQDKNLIAAKQNIDILELISQKTTGNLSPQESKLLGQLLYELRMKYVTASNIKA